MPVIRYQLNPKVEPKVASDCSAIHIHLPGAIASSGDSLAAWLADLTSKLPAIDFDAYWLPLSANDLTPAALFVLFDSPIATSACFLGTPMVEMRVDGDPVWIPTGCQIVPSIANVVLPDDDRGCFEGQMIRVWIPSIGLVGLTPEDRIRTIDWVDFRVQRQRLDLATNELTWRSPPEPTAMPTRIVEFGMRQPPTDPYIELIQTRREQDGPSLQDLPSAGSPSPLARARERLRKWMLANLEKLSGDKNQAQDLTDSSRSDRSGQASGPTGGALSKLGRSAGGALSALGAGASGVVARVAAPLARAMASMLQAERDAQIEKLIKMMGSDPDRGLEYAIPLGGQGNYRGLAIPGAKLISRMAEFSLAGMRGGSGPVDHWDIGYENEMRLRSRYREQANREVALGRYGRAAYIFAHLLNDMRAAAEVLVKGKRYADAAKLYRDELKNPHQAAECYQLGGMYREAAELWIAQQQFERAAESMQLAGSDAEAQQLYRRAVDHHCEGGRIVSAANVLRDSLHASAEAESLLLEQWPYGRQVLESLSLLIQWYGESERHEDTKAMIQNCQQANRVKDWENWAVLMCQPAIKYPDSAVRSICEDQCRLAVSRGLKAENASSSRLLDVINDLSIQQPQLRRDAILYRKNKEQLEVKKQIAAQVLTVAKHQPVRLAELPAIKLSQDVHFADAQVFKGILLALGWKGENAIVEKLQLQSSNRQPACLGEMKLEAGHDVAEHDNLFFVEISSHGKQFDVKVIGPFEKQQQIETTVWFHQTLSNLKLSWDLVSERTDHEGRQIDIIVRSDSGPEGRYEIATCGSDVLLRSGHGQTWSLIPSIARSMSDSDLPSGRIRDGLQLCQVAGKPIFSTGDTVFTIAGNDTQKLLTCSRQIQALSPSTRHTRPRVAIGHLSGLEILFLDSRESVVINDDDACHHCQWLPSGRLAVVLGAVLKCYSIRGSAATCVGEASLKSAEIVRILPLTANCVGILYRDGIMQRFEIPV